MTTDRVSIRFILPDGFTLHGSLIDACRGSIVPRKGEVVNMSDE